jgi:hypothetical protein
MRKLLLSLLLLFGATELFAQGLSGVPMSAVPLGSPYNNQAQTNYANQFGWFYFGNTNNWFEVAVQNTLAGTNASSDFTAYANNSTGNTNYYINLGINSSWFTNQANPPGTTNDGYLYIVGGTNSTGNLYIGTGSTNTYIYFMVGSLATNVASLSTNQFILYYGVTNYGNGYGITNLGPAQIVSTNIASTNFNGLFAAGGVIGTNISSTNFVGNGNNLTNYYNSTVGSAFVNGILPVGTTYFNPYSNFTNTTSASVDGIFVGGANGGTIVSAWFMVDSTIVYGTNLTFLLLTNDVSTTAQVIYTNAAPYVTNFATLANGIYLTNGAKLSLSITPNQVIPASAYSWGYRYFPR